MPCWNCPGARHKKVASMYSLQSSIIDLELAVTLETIQKTDKWNASPIALRPRHCSGKESVAIAVPATNENDEFLVDLEHVRTACVEVQRMKEPASRNFGESTSECWLGATGRAKGVSSFEDADS